MQCRESERTLAVLANGSELVLAITRGVVGNDIADSFDSAPLTRSLIFNLTQAKFQAAVAKHL